MTDLGVQRCLTVTSAEILNELQGGPKGDQNHANHASRDLLRMM